MASTHGASRLRFTLYTVCIVLDKHRPGGGKGRGCGGGQTQGATSHHVPQGASSVTWTINEGGLQCSARTPLGKRRLRGSGTV